MGFYGKKEVEANAGVNTAVALATVAAAGTLQIMSPGLPGSGLKAPLVVCAAVYWMVFRGPWTAWLGALWAGAALDGLGETPWGAGMLLMAGMCGGVRWLRQGSAWMATPPGCALACACAGTLLTLAQGALNGGLASAGWARVAAGILGVFLSGGVAGILMCGGLWALDAWLGNFKVVEARDVP